MQGNKLMLYISCTTYCIISRKILPTYNTTGMMFELWWYGSQYHPRNEVVAMQKDVSLLMLNVPYWKVIRIDFSYLGVTFKHFCRSWSHYDINCLTPFPLSITLLHKCSKVRTNFATLTKTTPCVAQKPHTLRWRCSDGTIDSYPSNAKCCSRHVILQSILPHMPCQWTRRSAWWISAQMEAWYTMFLPSTCSTTICCQGEWAILGMQPLHVEYACSPFLLLLQPWLWW